MTNEFREGCWLVKNGWPPETAFSLGGIYRMAATIVNGEFEGNEFDWDGFCWRTKGR